MVERFVAVRSIALAGMALAALTAQDVRADQATPAGQAAPAAQAAGGGRGPAPTPPCGRAVPADVKHVARDSRCFELRTYTVREGSSIDTLHTRFRDHTLALFRKHGMTVMGFWQPLSRPDTLIYLLAYHDGAARDAAWKAFGSDPEWTKARTALQVNVQVEAVFMNATEYGPMK